MFALLMLTVCVRMAVVPFHSWLPVLMARGPFGVGLLLVNAHAGLYLLVRVVMPLLPGEWSRGGVALGTLGLCAALYGSVLALAQTDLRRVVGFLLASQSGLMLAGLAIGNTQSISGALIQSVAAGIALTGLDLVVRAIEARTGTTDMTRLGGLVRRGPRLAAFFFLMGFGSLGFPGTLSFVGEDLLLHGILDTHPLVALPLLLTTAINGVTFLRAFQRTFLGPPAHGRRPCWRRWRTCCPGSGGWCSPCSPWWCSAGWCRDRCCTCAPRRWSPWRAPSPPPGTTGSPRLGPRCPPRRFPSHVLEGARIDARVKAGAHGMWVPLPWRVAPSKT
ncbi:complex I subunit 4 family protein [Cystobacter fuscus]